MPDVNDGFTIDTVTAALAFGLQGFFLIFVVISPLFGRLMHQQVKRRSSMILAVMAALLAFNVVFLGLSYILQEQGNFNDAQISIITLASAFITAVLVLYAVSSFLAEPDSQQEKWEDIVKGGSDFSFQEKRFERLKKRGKR